MSSLHFDNLPTFLASQTESSIVTIEVKQVFTGNQSLVHHHVLSTADANHLLVGAGCLCSEVIAMRCMSSCGDGDCSFQLFIWFEFQVEIPNLKPRSREKSESGCRKLPSFQHLLLSSSGMAGTENQNSNVNRRGKKVKYCSNDVQWLDLPEDLLLLILMQLSLVDFFAFGAVCKSWRLLASTNRRQFMECQSPLLVVLSSHAKRTVLLKNFFGGSIFKTVLPNFSGRTCYGVSCGYLVLKDNRSNAGLWLLNPLTRQEYHLSYPHNLARRVIVASSAMDSSDITIMALSGFQQWLNSNILGNLEIYRPRDEHSTMLHNIFEGHRILDLAIFKGKVVALTYEARVGFLNLRPHPKLTILAMKSISFPAHLYGVVSMPRLQLVASDEELFVVYVYNLRMFKVYKLNFMRLEWLEVDSLGDKAIFISYPMSIEITDAKRWGGLNNRIYCLNSDTYSCYCYALDGTLLPSIKFVDNKRPSRMAEPLWYFPHMSCSAPCLPEGYFG